MLTTDLPAVAALCALASRTDQRLDQLKLTSDLVDHWRVVVCTLL